MTQSLDNNSGYGDTERAGHVPPLPLPTRLFKAVAVSSKMSAITVVPEPNGRHRKKGILTEPGWCVGGGDHKAAEGYQQARPMAAQADAKTWVWEKSGEVVEEDQSDLQKFWQTMWRLRTGNQSAAKTVYIGRGKLLTSISSIPLTCLPQRKQRPIHSSPRLK